jgi:hypothetical protein
VVRLTLALSRGAYHLAGADGSSALFGGVSPLNSRTITRASPAKRRTDQRDTACPQDSLCRRSRKRVDLSGPRSRACDRATKVYRQYNTCSTRRDAKTRGDRRFKPISSSYSRRSTTRSPETRNARI